MPLVREAITDGEMNFFRPVIYSITKDLNEKMGFPSNLPIFYPGESGVTMQLNSTVKTEGYPSISSNEYNGSLFGSNELVMIEVDEMFDDSLRDTPVMQDEYMPIFRDTHLNIAMRPIYMPCIMNISYKYRCKDRGQAEIWRNKIRSKMTYYGDLNHHNLKYHYLIPEVFIHILKEIWILRENIAGYGESFEHYIIPRSAIHSSVRLTKLSNSNGKNTRLGIAENQTRVFGYYDFQVAPDKGSRESENSTWTASFNYKVRYMRPTEVRLDYPIFVHQQLLPIPFIPKPEDTMYEQGLGEERHFSRSGIAFENWTAQTQRRQRANWRNEGVRIPDFDEWLPGSDDKIPGTRRIFDILISLATDDKQQLLDLKEIPHIGFADYLQAFMQGEAKYMKYRGESVFQCSLYNQWSLLHNKYFEVHDDLTMHSLEKLFLRNMYHVRLSLYEDWEQLSHGARERLRKHPRIIKELLEHLGYDWQKICDQLNKLYNKYHHINTENRLRGMSGKIWRNEEGQLVEPPPAGGYLEEWKNYKEVPRYVMDKLIQIVSGKFRRDIRMFTVETSYVEAYDDKESYQNGIYYY